MTKRTPTQLKAALAEKEALLGQFRANAVAIQDALNCDADQVVPAIYELAKKLNSQVEVIKQQADNLRERETEITALQQVVLNQAMALHGPEEDPKKAKDIVDRYKAMRAARA